MNDQAIIISVLFTLAALGIYFLPLLIANTRGREGQVLIGIGNFLLGWTFIGWVVLLIVSFTGESKRDRQHREQIDRLVQAQQ